MKFTLKSVGITKIKGLKKRQSLFESAHSLGMEGPKENVHRLDVYKVLMDEHNEVFTRPNILVVKINGYNWYEGKLNEN